jgi:hypothetical protein
MWRQINTHTNPDRRLLYVNNCKHGMKYLKKHRHHNFFEELLVDVVISLLYVRFQYYQFDCNIIYNNFHCLPQIGYPELPNHPGTWVEALTFDVV